MHVNWFLSRRRIILSSIIDFNILFISYSFFLSNLDIYFEKKILIILIIFWIFLSYLRGRYSKFYYKNLGFLIIEEFKNIFFVMILSTFCLSVLSFIILKNDYDLIKIELFSFLIFVSILSFLSQIFLKNILSRRDKKNVFRVMILEEELDEKIYKYINQTFSKYTPNIKILNGNISKNIDDIVFLKEDINSNNVKNFLELKNNNTNYFTLSKWCETRLQRIPSDSLNSAEILYKQWGFDSNGLYSRFKRIADFTFSLFLILILSPIVIICAILIIFEDGGPIFYSQTRTGLNQKKFKVYKLRTMNVNSEKNGAQWSDANDKRVTKIGRILRKFRIDELPQLLLVINGKMSLIGPRPEQSEINLTLEKKIKNYNLRHIVRPGLSGWAQVNYPYGASVEDSDIKLSFDIFYIKNYSFLLDLIIFFKTLKLVFNAKGSLPKNNERI